MTINSNTINIVFRRKKALISRLIQLFTGCRYSHCGFLVPELVINNYILFVYESDTKDGKKGGVTKTEYSKWCEGNEIEVKVLTFDYYYSKHIITIAKQQLGKNYDLKGTALDQLIYQVFGVWKGYTGVKAEDKFYCSEYVEYCINKVLGIFPNWFLGSPAHLYKSKYLKTIYKGIDYNYGK